MGTEDFSKGPRPDHVPTATMCIQAPQVPRRMAANGLRGAWPPASLFLHIKQPFFLSFFVGKQIKYLSFLPILLKSAL